MVTWHFSDEDATAIGQEMRLQQAADRTDIRRFMRTAIRQRLAEAHERYGERALEEEDIKF
jgi:hypothetical protein